MSVNKKARHGDDAVRMLLPSDIVQRIALFIPNAIDFFNYLDSFYGTSISIGHLVHLWEASFQSPYHLLWPELHVDKISARKVASIQIDRIYFKTLHVHAVYDLKLLGKCIDTASTISFHTCPLENEISISLDAWYRQLSLLPVTHLTWLKGTLIGLPNRMDKLLWVLPQMTHLTSLDLSNACVASPDVLFYYIGNSKLKHLNIKDVTTVHGSSYTASEMSEGGVSALTQWLSTQPVESLSLSKWRIRSTKEMLLNLYHALWTCSTLRSLHASSQYFPLLDECIITQPFYIENLDLSSCNLTDEFITSLIDGIQGSKIKWLNLSYNSIHNTSMIALATALTHSSIETLFLNGCECADAGGSYLLNVLKDTKIIELSLMQNSLSDSFALFLGYVLRSVPTLQNLWLKRNDISISGATALINGVANRSEPFELIDLDQNRIDEHGQVVLDMLVLSEPRVRDCVFSWVA